MSKLKNGYTIELSITRGDGSAGIGERLVLSPGTDLADAEAELGKWLKISESKLWASAMNRSEPEATCERLLVDAAKWMAVLSRDMRIDDFPEGVSGDILRWIGEAQNYFARRGE